MSDASITHYIHFPPECWATIISYLTPDEIMAFKTIAKFMNTIITTKKTTQYLWQPTLNRLHQLDNNISTTVKGNILDTIQAGFKKINMQQLEEIKYLITKTSSIKWTTPPPIVLQNFQKPATTFAELETKNKILDDYNSAIIQHYMQLKQVAHAPTLDLDTVGITRLPSALLENENLQVYWTTLQSLNLNNNYLSAVPDEISKCLSLQHLFLSNNWLTRLPDCIGKLEQLKMLGFADNSLTVLPESMGQADNLPNLTLLYLDNNNLSFLPGNLTDRGFTLSEQSEKKDYASLVTMMYDNSLSSSNSADASEEEEKISIFKKKI